jgi:uncharacterized repeat protein (TIGR01451 family)
MEDGARKEEHEMAKVMNLRPARWFCRGCLMTIVALMTILILPFGGIESQATVSQALDSVHLATELYSPRISAPPLNVDGQQVSNDGCVVWTISSKLGISSQPTLDFKGNRVAFWSTGDLDPNGNNIDGNIELFMAEILTGAHSITPTQVTSSTGSILGGFNIAPSISADGSRITFFSDRDLTGENGDGSFEIFVYDVVAGALLQITQSRMGINTLPSINADGSCIAFASDQNFTGDNGDDNLEIFVYDADNEPDPFSQVTTTNKGINDSPALSADGTHIAFVTTSRWASGNLQNPDGNAEIFLYDAFTQVFTQVTTTEGGINEHPTINADGTRVVFASNHDFTGENGDGNVEIFMYETDAADYIQITDTNEGSNSYPSINAAGDLIVYAFNQGSVGQILLYDIVARSFIQIDELDQGVNSHPTTSASGLEVAYVHDREILIKRCPTIDLTLDKSTGDVTQVLAGTPLTYTFTITNHGPLNARNVRLNDPLPPELSYITATLSQGTCQDIDGTVVCALDSMPPTTTAWVTLTVAVDPMARVSVVNTATVEASGGDSKPEDNTDSVTTMIDVSSDLWLVKSCAAGQAVPGELLTYTLTITDIGPSGATGIVLTDVLPSSSSHGPGGVIYVSDTLGCDEVSGTVVCTLDDIVTGHSATVVITAQVEDDARGQLSNWAQVQPVEPDPVGGNNESDVSTGVYAETNLSLVKTTAVTEVIAGTDLTYNLTVTNLGPLIAFQVQLTDTLSGGLVCDWASSNCSCDDDMVTCSLGDMNSGDQATVDIHALVDPAVRGSVINTATVASMENDPVPGNNTRELETPVCTEIDLTLDKVGDSNPVDAGDPLVYDLTVFNYGPSHATGVRITDTLPLSVTFDSASANCAHANGVVTCDLGTINSGDSAAVDIHVEVSPTARGLIVNEAVVTGTEFEPDTSDNQDSVETLIQGRTNLRLLKWDEPESVQAGESLTYTLRIDNFGPSYATGVRVTDTLPLSVTFDSAPINCTHVAGVVACNLGGMASSTYSNIVIHVTVDPAARGQIMNWAIVRGNEYDPNLGNNADTEYTNVGADADLAVAKTDDPDPVLAGELLTYTLVVTNYGPATATNVQLTDELSEDVLFNSASPGCVYDTGEVVCGLGIIDVGNSVPVTICVTVDPATRMTIMNQASVESDEDDPNPVNDQDVEDTTVEVRADVVVVKTDDPDPVFVGELLTYTLTATNYGPATATNVRLTDTLPLSVTFDSAPGCTHANGVVVCNLGAIDPGNSVPVDIFVTVDMTTPGTIMNEAKVEADEFDPDLGNNDDVEDTTIEAQANLVVGKWDSPDPVQAGESLTYTLRARNWGPSDATGVRMTDTLPLSVTFDSAPPNCTHVAGEVVCDLGIVEYNTYTDTVIHVTVDPAARGTIVNGAAVRGNEYDPLPGNNAITRITTVTPVADLAIAKVGDPDLVLVGELLTYTLTVTNGGPSTATGVQLADTLPTSVLFDSASPGCTYGAGEVVCNLGGIDPGNNVQATICVTVGSTVGIIVNQATVSGNEFDPYTTNNTASTSTEVTDTLKMSEPTDAVAFNYDFALTGDVLAGITTVDDANVLGAAPFIAPTFVSGPVTVESLLLYLPIVVTDDSSGPGVMDRAP